MPRFPLVLALLAITLAAPSALAWPGGDSYDPEKPPPRLLVGGGVALPSFFDRIYGLGGGVGLGYEITATDQLGFVLRADFDHMNESEFSTASGGSLEVIDASIGARLFRLERGAIREHTGAAMGLARTQVWTTDVAADGTPIEGATRSRSRLGATFTIEGGVEYVPDHGPGFFMDFRTIFVSAGRGTAVLMPFQAGLLFPIQR